MVASNVGISIGFGRYLSQPRRECRAARGLAFMALAVRATGCAFVSFGAKPGCCGIAVHDGHLHVHQDDVERRSLPGGVPCLIDGQKAVGS